MLNGEQIFFTDQNLNGENAAVQGSNTYFLNHFKTFISNFTKENVRIYYKQISGALNANRPALDLDLADLKADEDESLYAKFVSNPIEVIGVMEDGVKSYVKEHSQQFQNCDIDTNWQVTVRSSELPVRLRDVNSSYVSKLFVVSGIIISCTKPSFRARKLRLMCRSCEATKLIDVLPGQKPYVPSYCNVGQKCKQDPYVALPTSQVVDYQVLKIQEHPEDMPTGEIARTYMLVADRYNVGRCVPGDRVRITGVMTVNEVQGENLTRGCIYVTGIEKVKHRMTLDYTQQQEEYFKMISRDPEVYQKITRLIAPGIYGNEDVKKAIACMLFGGSRKHLPDQTLLRGDINILLIGDPSTAKSQFLKFVEQTASIAVYTSGKGSSAAGLTASITKDSSTGQFQIEGGALVLADGGIVCIDEFDKMKPADRVAIHEAMEQQTISVAKAGITTRLNSRTSVLAAANPIHGSLKDSVDISDQIELKETILSRFDCIFVVRDINNPENNTKIAQHVLDLHQGKITRDHDRGEIPFELFKKYINYARNKISPRLTTQAADKLQNIYVADRQKVKDRLAEGKTSIPITVRQLEALIRLSESLARMKLRNQVTSDDVDEAHNLFQISTMSTLDSHEFDLGVPSNLAEEIQKIEQVIRKRMCIGNSLGKNKLVEELQIKHSEKHICYAINNMIKSGVLREVNARKQLIRDR